MINFQILKTLELYAIKTVLNLILFCCFRFSFRKFFVYKILERAILSYNLLLSYSMTTPHNILNIHVTICFEVFFLGTLVHWYPSWSLKTDIRNWIVRYKGQQTFSKKQTNKQNKNKKTPTKKHPKQCNCYLDFP